MADKLRVARLRHELTRGDGVEQFGDQLSTATALERFGFSPRMMRSFFRPFLGGVFLERNLETSAAKFAFVFRMFSMGQATVPAGGMRRIPEQLTLELEDRIRIGSTVSGIDGQRVILSTKEHLEADAFVVATDQISAARLTGAPVPVRSRSATTLYFEADEPPVEGPWLVLSGESEGVVNHLVVMSEVAASYAPEGRALISVTCLTPASEGLPDRVLRELSGWFGRPVRGWKHLRTFCTKNALPDERSFHRVPVVRKAADRVWMCGDYLGNASIDGAMLSGRMTAEAVMERL